MHSRLSSILLTLILCSSLFSIFQFAEASQVEKILNQEFYFHREKSGIEDYRFLNMSYPTRSDSYNFTANYAVGTFELGDGWVTPAIPKDFTITRSYNFLFSVWCAGSGKATLFFRFYAYRNENEHYLFTSEASEQLTTSALEMLWQHKTKEVTLSIKKDDRLVVRAYLNVSSSGRFGFGFDCTQYPSYIKDPEETRYMRSDTHTINGLLAFKLGTEQTVSFATASVPYSGDVPGYWGARVWKRNDAEVETELTDVTVTVNRTTDGSGLLNVNWVLSDDEGLNATDAIVVRVYMDNQNPPTTLIRTFITEQLGASKLDAATWTFYLWTQKSTAIASKTHYTDKNTHTVNTLTLNKHITSRDSPDSFYKQITDTSKTMYAAVRWYKIASDGTATEMGDSGTYKAEASRSDTGTKTGTYSMPEVSLSSTDAIRVNFYFRLDDNSFSEDDLAYSFITTQLGSTKLTSGTLTVYYYFSKAGLPVKHDLFFGWYWDDLWEMYQSYCYISGYKYEYTTTLYFRQGSSTYNSRIENFAWTEAAVGEWHSLVFPFTLITRSWESLPYHFSLSTMEWNKLTFPFTLLTREWQTLTFPFTLYTPSWHSLIFTFALTSDLTMYYIIPLLMLAAIISGLFLTKKVLKK